MMLRASLHTNNNIGLKYKIFFSQMVPVRPPDVLDPTTLLSMIGQLFRSSPLIRWNFVSGTLWIIANWQNWQFLDSTVIILLAKTKKLITSVSGVGLKYSKHSRENTLPIWNPFFGHIHLFYRIASTAKHVHRDCERLIVTSFTETMQLIHFDSVCQSLPSYLGCHL